MNSPQVLHDIVNGAMRRTVICVFAPIFRRGIFEGSKSACVGLAKDAGKGCRGDVPGGKYLLRTFRSAIVDVLLVGVGVAGGERKARRVK
jgi:hypothetical protein